MFGKSNVSLLKLRKLYDYMQNREFLPDNQELSVILGLSKGYVSHFLKKAKRSGWISVCGRGLMRKVEWKHNPYSAKEMEEIMEANIKVRSLTNLCAEQAQQIAFLLQKLPKGVRRSVAEMALSICRQK